MVIATISEAHIIYLRRGSTTMSQIVKMASNTHRFLSTKLTRFFMIVIGFWNAENPRKQWILNAVLIYTIAAVIFAIAVLGVDLYHCLGDLEAILDNICVTVPLIVIIMKTTLCLIQRDAVLHAITFAEKNFWNMAYDEFGEKILNECNKNGLFFLCTLSCAVEGTVSFYLVVPIFANIGQNETDRVLPYKLWVDLPLTTTPYYEITYTIQTLSTIHCAICFFCFDNLMGILNIHAVGQFKILQHRLTNLCEEYVNNTNTDQRFAPNYNGSHGNPLSKISYENLMSKISNDVTKYAVEEKTTDLYEKMYDELKQCIQKHQLLIDYVHKLDGAFNLVLLCQMGVSSIMLCLAGFRLFVDKHGVYIFHVTSVFTQMLLFTWSCNEIMVHSVEVGEAAFRCRWYLLPYDGIGRSIREALVLMIHRAQNPCHISAGGFIPISLQAFTNILSTTLSYLSVMRQMTEALQ